MIRGYCIFDRGLQKGSKYFANCHSMTILPASWV